MALTRLQPAALQPSSFSGLNITDGSLYPVDLSTGAPLWDTSGNVVHQVANNGASYLKFTSPNTDSAAMIGGYDDGSNSGHLEFYTKNAGTVTEWARLTSTGMLGLGIQSPTYRLDVSDNNTGTQLRLSSSSSYGCSMTFLSTSNNGRQYRIGSNFSLGTGEFAIYDATSTTNRLVVSSSGKIGIGETAPTQAQLEIAPSTQGAPGISVKSFAGDSNGLKLSMDAAGVGYINAGYSVSQLMLQTNGTSRLGISNNGDLTFYGRGVANVNPYIRTITTSDWTTNGQSWELPIHTLMGRDLRMCSILVMWGGTNYKTGGNHHHGGMARITVGYGNCTVTIDSTSIAGYTITGRTATTTGGYQQAWITVNGNTGTDTGSTFTGMLISGGGQF